MIKNTAIIVQARTGSSRLPNKILLPWGPGTILGEVMSRCLATGYKTILAMPYEDLGLALFYDPSFIGSSSDVLDRYYQAALTFDVQTIVRVTADCPLIQPAMIQNMVEEHNGNEYLSNCHPVRTVSHGFDVEIFPFHYLKKAWELSKDKYDREHVTPYIYNSGKFDIRTYTPQNGTPNNNINYSIDTIEDYNRLKPKLKNKRGLSPWHSEQRHKSLQT